MPHSSPFRVRFVIVGIFSALALAFLISPGNAQPGRPGGITGMPGGGIAGRPPGGIAGMPGGIHGGGIHGGGITGMPGGIHGGGIGGGIGGTTYSWSCGKCKASLGTTTTPFSPHTRCPSCGVTFTGSNITHGGGITPPFTTPGPPPGFGMPGGTTPPYTAPGGTPPFNAAPGGTEPPNTPTLPINPAVGNGGPVSAPAGGGSSPPDTSGPAPTNPTPPTTSGNNSGSSATPAPPASSGRSKTFALVGIVVGVLLLVGALAALAFVVSNANAAKPAKRKRKVFDDD